VHGLITASAVMDWSYGASILTFVFPMLLFIGVAAALYVVYTKPHLVPGHHYEMQMRSVSHTAAPTMPGTSDKPGGPTAVDTSTIAGHAPPESDNEV
jgi:hypothetical protein